MFEKKFFGDRLRALRMESGVPQTAIAELLGVTRTQVSDIENGKTTTSIERLVQLSDFFSVPIDYLLGITDIPDVPDWHVYPEFPLRLKELRIRSGMSEETAAEMLEVSWRNYCGYEVGEVMPQLPLLCAMADQFDVSLDYLVGRTDKPG